MWSNRITLMLIGVVLHGITTIRHVRRSLLGLLGLLLFLVLLLQTDLVQNFILHKVTHRLSADLQTEVKIKYISFSFFDKMDLKGVLIKDRQKDTLLYAGTMKLRVTDWFFLSDQTDLKYIGLEDAKINLHRKDSVWNYAFIADHFASPKTVKDSVPKTIALNIQKIDLKKVTFIQNDEWIGQKMVARVGSMLLDAKRTNLNSNEYEVNTLDIDRPYFLLEDFDGRRPDSLRRKPDPNDTSMYFNAGDISLKINTLHITDGTFASIVRGDVPEKGLFDGAYIKVNKINGVFNHFSFIKDTMKAQVELSAVERSGLELKKLKADVKLTPQIMEFDHLDIQTPESRIGNYYAMRYRDFNEDMKDYISKVTMDIRIRNSSVSSEDVAYFAPELSDWNRQVDMNGKFFGTVEDFSVQNLFMRSGPDMYASGELDMKGLPDIDKTKISLNRAVVQTNNRELAFLYPDITKITSPNLAALGNIRFLGDFNGTVHDFTAKGNITTKLGGLYSDINMKLPSRGEPSYGGTLQAKQFDIGKFLDEATLGKASFKGTIEGKSFAIERAKTKVNIGFDSLDFNGYTYHNLNFDGAVEKRKFIGDFKASDPNFDFTSSINIDFTGQQPRFNILGDLANANFQKLNFTKENVLLTGLFDLNFTGRNIDEFLGSAKILNATLLHDNVQLDFDSLSVNASYDDINKKILSVQSNQFDASVTGQYNILDLPNSFQLFLNRYYPAYINAPKTTPKNQQFQLVLHTMDFDKYANVIDRRLSGLNNVEIIGGVNTNRPDSGLYIYANIPQVKFDTYQMENALITGLGSIDSLQLNGTLGNVYLKDSFYFPGSAFDILSSQDHSSVHISTRANATLDDASLNAEVITLEDGVRINFLPSSFVLNTNKWELDKEGELVIRKNFATARNVKFTQGFQEITVETEEEDGGNTSNLVVKLKDVNLGDFVPLFTKKPAIEGVANGSVYLQDFYNKFHADADITARQFRLDNDSIGIVKLKAAYNSTQGKINWDVVSDNENYTFNSQGYYNIKDSVSQPLNTSIHLNNTKINLISQFLVGLFSDLDGYATGDLIIKGNPNTPQLLGKVALRDAAITVDYTQVRYNIDSALFNFNENGIDFGHFTVKDKYKNTGSVRGYLYEAGFEKMRFDFDMATDKMLLLDTKAKDNQQFYGKAIGEATLSLKGPQENMRMNITGSVNDSTHISIPTSTSKESADADFIVFKKYGEDAEKVKPATNTKLNIDLDLTANNQAQIDMILDELTGDIISATGNGRLRINVPASGNLTMNGRYNIESGRYNFNFQSFLRKPFDLKREAGSYIEWTGDPYKADMHVDAQYTAKNIGFGDLLSNTGYNLGGTVSGYRGDVYVLASLTGKLTNPQIKFGFDFPDNSPIKNDNNLKLFLDKVQSDDNEMLKQVTWLIVFNSFAPYGDIGGGGGNVARNTGINTISQKITGEVNKLVSNLLSKITGDKSLQFDVNTSTYSSAQLYGNTSSASSNRLDRQSINLKLSQSLANNKIIITFGTGLDFNISGSAVQTGNFQWLPDISVQFVLSRDRKLRAIVFNKSSLDVSTGLIGRRIRQGVSISYTFDFPKDEPNVLTADTTRPAIITDSTLVKKP
ncbi:hypothetical protein GD597_21090 [Panacibacter sp. KCS-6]|uniref:Translocation and assembly module TamB C-terminal domain-containing protein n=2 Tax=Limnovirga soli TaxID=2656915 RepID=A0A8J8FHH9_9BACT|nr:hypothetical protein [Limnovirga soli]